MNLNEVTLMNNDLRTLRPDRRARRTSLCYEIVEVLFTCPLQQTYADED